jgi:hypothetical protein
MAIVLEKAPSVPPPHPNCDPPSFSEILAQVYKDPTQEPIPSNPDYDYLQEPEPTEGDGPVNTDYTDGAVPPTEGIPGNGPRNYPGSTEEYYVPSAQQGGTTPADVEERETPY